MNALTTIYATPPGALTTAEIDATMAYAEAEKAPATRVAYASDWKDFAVWCLARGAVSLPAHQGIVAAYLSSLADAGRKVEWPLDHDGAPGGIGGRGAGYPIPAGSARGFADRAGDPGEYGVLLGMLRREGRGGCAQHVSVREEAAVRGFGDYCPAARPLCAHSRRSV